MSTWLNSIKDGISIYMTLAPILFLPLGIAEAVKDQKLNPMRFVMVQLFSLYMTCVFALVFLPLPSMAQAENLVYRMQAIPFYFIVSLCKDFGPAGILNVIFNIVMTIPFGMFLRYYFGLNRKQVILCGFLLTCFIEIGQLTGLFFLYKGSYRLFDTDDLIQNTLGCGLGFMIVQKLEGFFPAVADFDYAFAHVFAGKGKASTL